MAVDTISALESRLTPLETMFNTIIKIQIITWSHTGREVKCITNKISEKIMVTGLFR